MRAGRPPRRSGARRGRCSERGRRLRYSDVSGRLAVADAPLWLHLRFEADGRLALRSALAALKLEWVERGVWLFDGQAGTQDLRVLMGLREGLIAAHGAESVLPGLHAEDQHSRAVLVLDADATVPWRHLQWAVTIAANRPLETWRLTFLSPGGADFAEVLLPHDDEALPREPEVLSSGEWHGVTLALHRSGIESEAGSDLTLLKLYVADGLAGPDVDLSEAQSGIVYLDEPEPWLVARIHLPSERAPSGAHAAAWRELARSLDSHRGGTPRFATLKVPLQSLPNLPSADAIEALLRLREAGFEHINLAGIDLPTTGKGWGPR